MDKGLLIQMTSDIVASHASVNEMGCDELLAEMDLVFNKLASLSGGFEEETAPEVETGSEPPRPAVPLAAAFGADKVFCMVCGQGMKTLKRHLATSHGMKPGQYRRAYGVPAGTPLVAKNYSESRKKMAQELKLADRLGKARAARMGKAAERTDASAPAEVTAPKPVRRRGARKSA